jgi:E3 SUMO-protein ligase PIAS1
VFTGSYFDQILKQTPDSVEDIVVEADGDWHTGDNKYASARWKLSHPATSLLKAPLTPRKSTSVMKSPMQTPAPTKERGKENPHNVEIVILDSDDEDEGRVKRELSPSFASGTSGSAHQSFDSTSLPLTQSQSEDVIDLTLDSDDDEPAPEPTSRVVEKRKAMDFDLSHDLQYWKKARANDGASIQQQMAIRTITNGPISGTGPSVPSPSATAYRTNGIHYPSYPGQRSPTQLPSSRPASTYSTLAGRYPQFSSHSSLHRNPSPTSPRVGTNSSPHTSSYPNGTRINGSSSTARWP